LVVKECQVDYQVVTREIAPQSIISIRDRHRQSELPSFLGWAFGDLFSHLKVLGVEPGGPPFVIYHAFGPDGIDAEVCVPVGQPVSASGRSETRELPAMTVAETLHVGPYEELEAAYTVINDWIAGHGYEAAGPVQERYLNGPGDVASPAEYQTEIEVPIVRVAVPV
jgi:effector-binding domain-containing protein